MAYLSYIVNIMTVDAMATHGARSSTAYFCWTMLASAIKGLKPIVIIIIYLIIAAQCLVCGVVGLSGVHALSRALGANNYARADVTNRHRPLVAPNARMSQKITRTAPCPTVQVRITLGIAPTNRSNYVIGSCHNGGHCFTKDPKSPNTCSSSPNLAWKRYLFNRLCLSWDARQRRQRMWLFKCQLVWLEYVDDFSWHLSQLTYMFYV